MSVKIGPLQHWKGHWVCLMTRFVLRKRHWPYALLFNLALQFAVGTLSEERKRQITEARTLKAKKCFMSKSGWWLRFSSLWVAYFNFWEWGQLQICDRSRYNIFISALTRRACSSKIMTLKSCCALPIAVGTLLKPTRPSDSQKLEFQTSRIAESAKPKVDLDFCHRELPCLAETKSDTSYSNAINHDARSSFLP